jgi:hypothetical protein
LARHEPGAGIGNDFPVCGAGANIFRLDGSSGFDPIRDFNCAGGNRIVLSGGIDWAATAKLP